MKQFVRHCAIAVLLLTSACSTVLEGRTQRIAVDTIPAGADCQIKDNDTVLAKVHSPGTAEIEKSKNDILVECNKEGYITNRIRNRSDIAISSIGNMAFGQWSFIGNAVDSASGASHKYDSRVFLAMNPLPPVAIAPQGAAIQTAAGVPANFTNLPPEQLAAQLSQMFHTPNVIVSNQSPEDVMRLISGHQQVTQETAQEMAILTADRTPIQHSAE